ncbi:MAG: hypothetical protein KTR30_28245 [Saprospiraceae bacterium]|nr:hypothetical protein [Saprospiraceae bacterium]
MQQNASDHSSTKKTDPLSTKLPLFHPLTPLRISYRLLRKISAVALRSGRRRTGKAGMAFYQHLFQKIGDDFKPY